MNLIGFAVITLALLFLTLVWVVVAFNSLGKYNIGGVPNTLLDRAKVILAFAAVIYLWIMLFHNAPFVITLKEPQLQSTVPPTT